MKKHHPKSRQSERRRTSRASRRRALENRRTNLRVASAGSVPVNSTADACEHYLACGAYSERPAAGAIDPLDALNASFRETTGWSAVHGKANPKSAVDIVIGMRRPEREYVSGSGHRFVAINSEHYRGDAAEDRNRFEEFWGHQLNGRPFSMDFLKSGPAIWAKLGIDVPTETTAYMMQMHNVDAETSQAVQAAIWSAYNTASSPIDIETVSFALATFLHADPLRRHLVSDKKYAHPYGEQTQYVLRKIYGVPDVAKPVVRKISTADLPPSQRCLPIEADEERRLLIKVHEVNPEHLATLDSLKLLMTSEAEKNRIFRGGLDGLQKAMLNYFLDEALNEIENEYATVVGIVNVLLMAMLDIAGDLRSGSQRLLRTSPD